MKHIKRAVICNIIIWGIIGIVAGILYSLEFISNSFGETWATVLGLIVVISLVGPAFCYLHEITDIGEM